jgi:hypothetical protein
MREGWGSTRFSLSTPISHPQPTISPPLSQITTYTAGNQGQGFGQQILSELETRASARGYTTLHLHTSTVQVATQMLYEKHGYYEVRREMYYELQITLYKQVLR